MKYQLLLISCIASCILASTPTKAEVKNYKFIVFPEKCYDIFFNQGQFTNVECIKLTLSRGVGLSIVVLSTILKVPQILKILKAKSVEGLSFTSLIFENVLYLFTVSYNIFKGNSFSLYGESVIIAVQNFIVMSLFAVYGKNFSVLKLLLSYAGIGAISAPLLLQIVPSMIYEYTLIINMGIFFASRAPQIYQNFKNKSTGQLAVATYILNTAGSIARIFTVLTEAPDLFVLFNYLESTLMNGTILLQIIFFWKKSDIKKEQKKVEDKKKKQ